MTKVIELLNVSIDDTYVILSVASLAHEASSQVTRSYVFTLIVHRGRNSVNCQFSNSAPDIFERESLLGEA